MRCSPLSTRNLNYVPDKNKSICIYIHCKRTPLTTSNHKNKCLQQCLPMLAKYIEMHLSSTMLSREVNLCEHEILSYTESHKMWNVEELILVDCRHMNCVRSHHSCSAWGRPSWERCRGTASRIVSCSNVLSGSYTALWESIICMFFFLFENIP